MEEPQVAAASDVRSWDRAIVTYPLFALIAIVGGFYTSFTLGANVLAIGVGGILFWLGLAGRLGRRPAPRRLSTGTLWWLVPVLLFAIVELFAFGHGSTYAYPTLSILTAPVLQHYFVRATVYFAWLVGFWGLVRR
jgi:hypothetical protein